MTEASPSLPDVAQQRLRARAWAEAKAESERQELARVGLRRIEEAAATGLEIRRARYFLWPLSAASVTLSRMPAGGTNVRIAARSTSVEAPVAKAVWTELAAHEAEAFARQVSRDVTVAAGFCHGLEVTIEAASPGKMREQKGHSCGAAESRATLDYATRLARLAVDSIPACEEARQREPEAISALFACLGRDSR
jgi:hypothetical protein